MGCHCYREDRRGKSIVGRRIREIGVLIIWAREVGGVALLCFAVSIEGGPCLFVLVCRVVRASLSMMMMIDYIGFIRRGDFYFLPVQRHAVSRELGEMTDCLSRSEISQNLILVHEEGSISSAEK